MARTGPDCFVCRKHRGETDALGGAIYEDALLYAGHAAILPDAGTAYLGYLIVYEIERASSPEASRQ